MYDFVLVHEHWLIEQNLGVFRDKIPGICCHGVSAVDSSVLLQGRPHGGCSILWASTLTCRVSPVDSGNNRVAAVIVDADLRFLLVTLYLPVDNGYDANNLHIFNEALAAAAALGDIHGVNFIVYGGDFSPH